MTPRIAVHDDAVNELQAAALWYEGQREGLGLQFLAALERTVEHLRAWPDAGSELSEPSTGSAVRRMPVPRFPYHLIYLREADVIHILAVAHDHRRPGFWKDRSGGVAGSW